MDYLRGLNTAAQIMKVDLNEPVDFWSKETNIKTFFCHSEHQFGENTTHHSKGQALCLDLTVIQTFLHNYML